MAIDIAKLLVTVGADIGEFESEMGKANGLLGGFAGVGKAAVLGAASAMGAAIVGFGTKAAMVAADFEGQMNILEVAARSAGTPIDDLRTAAIQVGADLELVGISGSEAADAMTNFYKAGLDTTMIFGDLNAYLNEGASLTGALRAAVDLAAASELDLAQTSELVAVAMATFGLSADEATGIADSFVGAADASVTSVGQLAEGLRVIGPTFAAFGGSLEEANTALAILSTRGIEGSYAGTGLRSMMTNMMRDTPKVTAALDELGISLYNTDGTLKRLPDLIGDFSTAMAGMTQKQRDQYVQTLAGVEGMSVMNTLLAEGLPGWEAMAEGIANAATAQEVAEARTRGLKAAWEQLQGTLETLMINVGTPLIENFITPAVQGLTEWVGVLADMVPSSEQVSAALEGMKTAFANVTAEVSTFLADPLGYVREAWPKWRDTLIEAFNSAIADTVKWLETKLGDSFTMMEAVAWLIDPFAFAKQQWPTWRDTLTTALGSAVSEAVTWLESNTAPYVTRLWDGLRTWIADAVEHVRTNAGTWAGELGTALGSMVSAAAQWLTDNVTPYATSLWNGLNEWVSGAIGQVQDEGPGWVSHLGEWVGGILGDVAAWVQTNAPTYAKKLWEAYKAWLGAVVPLFLDGVKLYVTEIVPGVIKLWGSVAQWLIDNVSPYAEELWGAFKEWLSGAIAHVTGNAPAWGETVGTAVGSALSSAATWLTTNVAPKALELYESLRAWITGALGQFSANAEGLGSDLGTKLGEMASTAITWLTGQAIPKAKELWGAWLNILGGMADTFTANAEGLGGNWGEILGKVVRYAVGGLIGAAAGLATLLWNAIKSIFTMATAEGGGGDNRAKEMAGALSAFFNAAVEGFISGLLGDPMWKSKVVTWIQDSVITPIEDFDLGATMSGLINKILEPLKKVSLIDIGKDMITGLADGIAEQANTYLKEKAEGVAKLLPGWVKKLLGVESPSKVFAEIGANLMSGMALGIERSSERPVAAMAQATRNVTNAPTYNLNASFASPAPSNTEALLRQLLQEIRGRGYGGAMPDVGIP